MAAALAVSTTTSETQAAVLSVLVDYRGCCAILGLAPTRNTRLFLWRQWRSSRFPKPVRIGGQKIFWHRVDLDAFLSSLKSANAEGK